MERKRRWRPFERLLRVLAFLVLAVLLLAVGAYVLRGPLFGRLLAERIDERLPTPDTIQFPKSLIGGGCVLSSTVQGDERFGSVGCLVTDGRRTYALSNAHVVGEPGSEVFSYFRGRRERVGVAANRQLRKLPFPQAYPGWPGDSVLLNADVGLVDADAGRIVLDDPLARSRQTTSHTCSALGRSFRSPPK